MGGGDGAEVYCREIVNSLFAAGDRSCPSNNFLLVGGSYNRLYLSRG